MEGSASGKMGVKTLENEAKESTLTTQIKKKNKTTQRPIRQTISAHGIELSPVQLSKIIKRKRQGPGDLALEDEIRAITHHHRTN